MTTLPQPSLASRDFSLLKPVLGLILILGFSFLIYAPALKGKFILDDRLWIPQNKGFESRETLTYLWTHPFAFEAYQPLTSSLFWIEHRILGDHTLGYHFVSVTLHAANAVLIGLLLSQLAVPGAWLAAFLFLVHPLQVESVAYITEQKNVLSLFFSLLCVLAYARFSGWEDKIHRHEWKFYILSVVLFACALLSKAVTCTLPGTLFLLLWWKRERVSRLDVATLVPFFLLGLCLGLLAIGVEDFMRSPDVHLKGSLFDRFLIAGHALWFYAAKLLWPADLTLIYPPWTLRPPQIFFWIPSLLLGGLLWFSRSKIGRGPLAAFLYFVGTLAPTLGFLNVNFMEHTYVSDHWLYHASVGIFCLVSALWEKVKTKRDVLSGFSVGVILVLGFLTWKQCFLYRKEETLWRHTLTSNPRAAIAHNNLGAILYRQGNLLEAKGHYRRALRLKPDYVDAHNNLAIVLLNQQRWDEAIGHLEQALAIRPHDTVAHTSLGIALVGKGNLKEAIVRFAQAARQEPWNPEIQANLKSAFIRAGRGT